MIAAILRAQWLSMRSFSMGSRRSATAVSAIIGFVFYGFWVLGAVAIGAFLATSQDATWLPILIPVALLTVMMYWQIAPVISASLGASLDLKKLLVYPIPHEKLFQVEVLLRLTACVEMLIIITGMGIGLMRNSLFGGILSVPRILLVTFLFIVLNLLIAAGLRNLMERLLLKRRLREVMVVLLILVSVLPQLLLASKVNPEAMTRYLPASVFWPWGAAGHLLLGLDWQIGTLVLMAALGLAYAFSRWQFAISLRFDPASSSRKAQVIDQPEGKLSLLDRACLVPRFLFADPLGAIVEKEIRSLIRTPRFRLVFGMSCLFGLLVWTPRVLRGGSAGGAADHFLTMVCVYGLVMLGQVMYMNAFGFDRSAAQAWFSLPVSFGRVLVGKNLAAALFVITEMLVVTAIAMVLPIPKSPLRVAEAIVVTLVSGIYLIAFGNLSSVYFPRALSPEKVTQGGGSRSLSIILVLCFPIVLLPVGLAYWARYVFGGEVIFFALLALAAVLGAPLYWIALGSSVEAAILRRERILTELAKSDGPLSIG